MSRRRVTRPGASSVLGWLADGTAYYAPLGQLVRDADDDTVQCHLCGRYMRFVFGNHLYGAHGWTRDQYIAAFGLLRSTSSVSSDLSVAASRRMTVRVSGDERLRAGMARGQDMARSGELHRRLREAVADRGISRRRGNRLGATSSTRTTRAGES